MALSTLYGRKIELKVQFIKGLSLNHHLLTISGHFMDRNFEFRFFETDRSNLSLYCDPANCIKQINILLKLATGSIKSTEYFVYYQ